MKKFSKGLFVACGVFGLFLMLGTAGACDLMLIEYGAIVFRSFLALILTVVGFIGYKVIDYKL